MSKIYEIDVSDTVEELDAVADMFAERMEYELRARRVMCDICDAWGYAPEKALRANGWELGPGYAICPNHD